MIMKCREISQGIRMKQILGIQIETVEVETIHKFVFCKA
jgi:hypothetical protein